MSIIETKRKAIGLSVTELAKRVGVSRTTLYKWINKTSMPTLKELFKLSDVLSITVNKIVLDFKKESEVKWKRLTTH